MLNELRVSATASTAASPGEGPAYRYFYGELHGADEATRSEALRLGIVVDRAGRLFDAQRAYRFFYGEMSASNDRARIAAAKAAAEWIRGGHGTFAELEQAYKFIYGEFAGADDKTKAAAAHCAALAIGVGLSPAEFTSAYHKAYRMLGGYNDDAKLTAALIAAGGLD